MGAKPKGKDDPKTGKAATETAEGGPAATATDPPATREGVANGLSATPLRPDKYHPVVWLAAALFGAGGAGTVWLSQKNEVERLNNQVHDLERRLGEQTKDISVANGALEAEKTAHSVCENELLRQRTLATQHTGTTVAGSQNVGIGGSTVAVGAPCPTVATAASAHN
jgi:hypothetical protein